VGFKLRREIRDLLPRGLLTPSEWRLVLEVADSCDDDTRAGWPGAELLAQRTDTPDPDKVGEMFNRIAKKWVELRTPIGLGKDGRAFYSSPGRAVTYCFPPADKLKALQTGGPSKAPEFGGPKVPDSEGPKAPQRQPKRPPKSGDPSPQGSSPQKETSSLSHDSTTDGPPVGAASDRERDQRKPKIQTPTALVTPLLTDPATAEAVIAEIIEANGVDKPNAFFIHTSGNGTLPELVRLAEAALGDTHDKAARGRFLQEIGWDPQCEHGVHGGHIQQPGTGWVACAMERKRLERSAVPRSDGRRTSTREELGDRFGGHPNVNPDHPNKLKRSYDYTAPGAGNFGDRPYRNPTDPHAYDSYEAGPRR
jgi:hypothetical protein